MFLKNIFRSKKRYMMDQSIAEGTLQNVFAACHREPNVTPFSEILKNNRLNNTPYNLGIWVCLVFFILSLLCPLTFTQTDLKEYYSDAQYIYLDCSGKQLDPDRCYIRDTRGLVYSYHSFNAQNNTITFEKPDTDATLHLIFSNGKEIQKKLHYQLSE